MYKQFIHFKTDRSTHTLWSDLISFDFFFFGLVRWLRSYIARVSVMNFKNDKSKMECDVITLSQFTNE